MKGSSMKWIAGILLTLEMGFFSHYGASEHQNTASEIKQNITLKQPFGFLDIVKAKLPFQENATTRPVAMFTIDAERLSAMKRGEVFILENMEYHTYRLKVKEKHYFRNYTTLDFKCLQHTRACAASVRIGSTQTFMRLQTSHDIYEMEAKDDIAYFYRLK